MQDFHKRSFMGVLLLFNGSLFFCLEKLRFLRATPMKTPEPHLNSHSSVTSNAQIQSSRINFTIYFILFSFSLSCGTQSTLASTTVFVNKS